MEGFFITDYNTTLRLYYAYYVVATIAKDGPQNYDLIFLNSLTLMLSKIGTFSPLIFQDDVSYSWTHLGSCKSWTTVTKEEDAGRLVKAPYKGACMYGYPPFQP